MRCQQGRHLALQVDESFRANCRRGRVSTPLNRDVDAHALRNFVGIVHIFNNRLWRLEHLAKLVSKCVRVHDQVHDEVG